MPWRFWIDIYKEYYSAMIWLVDYLDNFKQPELENFVRTFMVELESSDLSNEAKCNFLDIFIRRDKLLVSTYFANKNSIVSSKKEEWEKNQQKGIEDIINIIERAKWLGPNSVEALKYKGISFLTDCDLDKEHEYKEYYKKILIGESMTKDKDKTLNLKK